MTEPLESRIHVLNDSLSNSLCETAIFGDKAITLEQAQTPDNGLYFDCEACYLVLRPTE